VDTASDRLVPHNVECSVSRDCEVRHCELVISAERAAPKMPDKAMPGQALHGPDTLLRFRARPITLLVELIHVYAGYCPHTLLLHGSAQQAELATELAGNVSCNRWVAVRSAVRPLAEHPHT
jgi:hypothetical protein